ncbi:MAG: LPXTG cell wall anchor domain-containing protein [Chloroflexi bacterium]|nr:LPXTG cell wall anchor domain-containing protein [Chloroflexota bacterium]
MIGGTTYYLVQSLDGGGVPAAPPAAAVPSPIQESADNTANPFVPAPTATPRENMYAFHQIGATGTPTSEPTATLTPTNTPSATPTVASSPTLTPTLPPTIAETTSPTDTVAPTILSSSTPLPVDESATSDQRPATGNLSYWFIGVGLLLAVGLGGWAAWNGRR